MKMTFDLITKLQGGVPGTRFELLGCMLAILGSAAMLSAAAPPLSQAVGLYHWDGKYTTSMSQGVEHIARLGGHVARVALSARYYGDYHTGVGCYPNFSLSALAQEGDVKRALGNEAIDVFMLTAYDGVTLSDCTRHRYLEPGFYTPSNVWRSARRSWPMDTPRSIVSACPPRASYRSPSPTGKKWSKRPPSLLTDTYHGNPLLIGEGSATPNLSISHKFNNLQGKIPKSAAGTRCCGLAGIGP